MPLSQTDLAKFQEEMSGLCAKYNVELYPNIVIGIRDIPAVMPTKIGEVEEGIVKEVPPKA
jgi:hypothetical protein